MKHLLLSILLLIVATTLFLVFLPFGIIFALLNFRGNKTYPSKIILRIAVSIDQLANVTCAGLFNHILVKGVKPFGLEDDTVSEVLSKNRYNLTKFGTFIVKLLLAIDPGHLNDALVENINY